ncbi:unnamed protein product, partial [Ectocarpus sp. 12 AP-2014]
GSTTTAPLLPLSLSSLRSLGSAPATARLFPVSTCLLSPSLPSTRSVSFRPASRPVSTAATVGIIGVPSLSSTAMDDSPASVVSARFCDFALPSASSFALETSHPFPDHFLRLAGGAGAATSPLDNPPAAAAASAAAAPDTAPVPPTTFPHCVSVASCAILLSACKAVGSTRTISTAGATGGADAAGAADLHPSSPPLPPVPIALPFAAATALPPLSSPPPLAMSTPSRDLLL